MLYGTTLAGSIRQLHTDVLPGRLHGLNYSYIKKSNGLVRTHTGIHGPLLWQCSLRVFDSQLRQRIHSFQ